MAAFEKNLKNSEYWREINLLLDEVYAEADKRNWSLPRMSKEAGVSMTTVWMIYSRKTKYPHYSTVLRLVKSVGMELLLQKKLAKSIAG